MWEASQSESVARQLHFLPHFPASSNTVLLQACIGLHLLLGSCGFQFNACFWIDSSPFLRVWLIHCQSVVIIYNIISFSRMAYYTKSFCSGCINLFYFPNSVVVWVITFRRVVTIFKTNVGEAIVCHHILIKWGVELLLSRPPCWSCFISIMSAKDVCAHLHCCSEVLPVFLDAKHWLKWQFVSSNII